MKNLWSKMLLTMTAFFATSETLKGKDLTEGSTLNLSAEEQAEIDKHFAQDGLAEKFMTEFNKQSTAEADNAEAKQLAQQFLAESNHHDEDDEEDAAKKKDDDDAENATASQMLKKVLKEVGGIKESNAQLREDNKRLAALPDDAPTEKVTAKINTNVKHSKTHLFATNNSFDSLERTWNKALQQAIAQGNPEGIQMTNWGDNVNVNQLNQDLGEYHRQHRGEIISLIKDGLMIPEHWDFVSGVADEYISVSLQTGEVTQGWKAQFLPKNKQRFVPIKNKIFDKQIDVLFTPKDLKSIEKNYLRMWFDEGSNFEKPRFVQFLTAELFKKARKEDKISIFKGVFQEITDDATTAGSYLNAMDGYLKIVDDNRGTTFNAHNLPAFTPENTYDVIQDWIENKIPYSQRIQADLVLQIGTDAHRWYHESRERKKGTNIDYARVMHVEKFPNIMFVGIPQWEGTGFVDLQMAGNCGMMVDRPGEENTLKFETFERNVKGMGDYKLGVFFKAFGANVKEGEPVTFEDQIYYCNNVPLLDDVYVNAQADDSTPSVAEHNALAIGASNTQATDITNIDDATGSQYVYLFGDSDSNVSTVKNNANLILDGADFVLNKGNKITLKRLSTGKFIEVYRFVNGQEIEEAKIVLAADATTADAADGNSFLTSANTAATEFTDITGAVKDAEYTLTGGSDTNPTSITQATTEKFLVSADVSLTQGSYVTVLFNGSKFVEIARG